MSKNKCKYDKFYYTKDDSDEHSLNELTDVTEEIFNRDYKEKIKCPGCHGPQLTLVHRLGIVHLRTYKNQKHRIIDGKPCIYSVDEATNKEISEYIKSLQNAGKIQSLLESVIRSMENRKPQKEKEQGKEDEEELQVFIPHPEKKYKKQKRVPRYSFRSIGPNIPEDLLCVFYGKVRVSVKNHTYEDGERKETYSYLHIRDVKSNKLLTTCPKPPRTNISEGVYLLSILGKCVCNSKNGKTYYNIRVNSPMDSSIVFKGAPSEE